MASELIDSIVVHLRNEYILLAGTYADDDGFHDNYFSNSEHGIRKTLKILEKEMHYASEFERNAMVCGMPLKWHLIGEDREYIEYFRYNEFIYLYFCYKHNLEHKRYIMFRKDNIADELREMIYEMFFTHPRRMTDFMQYILVEHANNIREKIKECEYPNDKAFLLKYHDEFLIKCFDEHLPYDSMYLLIK